MAPESRRLSRRAETEGEAMSDYICFLITLFYEAELIRCALKVKRDTLPSDLSDYPMEYRDELHKLLPLHVRSCGPIVEIEEIFEVSDVKP